MNKCRLIRLLWLMALPVSTEIAAYGQAAPISVSVRLVQSQVKNRAELLVATSIRNDGTAEQSLQVWSCSYPKQWRTDNPAIHIPDVPCKKNDLIRLKLKAGEVYERELSLEIRLDAAGHAPPAVTFRLGLDASAVYEKPELASPIWSNAITASLLK